MSGAAAAVEAPAALRVRTLPGRRLAWLALLGLPLYVFGSRGVGAGLAYDALLIAAALYEARMLRRALPLVERRFDARLLVGVPSEIALRLRNLGGERLRLTVRDDYPGAFSADEDELHTVLEPHGRAELRYRAVSARRGRFAFGDIHLRVEGLLSLAALLVTRPCVQTARVYPNLRGPRRYELAFRLNALRSVGVRALRRPGGGGEFEQLREYVPGDPYRDVDWKASAKRKRPVTRVYGQEQSQTVVIALDAGRMMATALREESGATPASEDALSSKVQLTKLDHAINAALLLAYVALHGGDKVGLVVFADEVQQFVAPRRGHAQYRRLLEALSLCEASQSYVDFRRLTELLSTRLPRRSLLVIFSDLLDESQALPLAEQAPFLRRRHLPLCVGMTDPVVSSLAERAPANDEQAYRRAAAAALLEDRETIKAHLRKSGVGVVEATAAELAIATVNRYLEIKAKHAL